MTKFTTKKQIIRESIVFLIVILIWFLIDQSFSQKRNFMFSFTNLLIVIYSYWGAFRINKKIPYSSDQVLYLFSLFFFGFAPLFQFKNNIQIWGGYKIADFDFIIANFIILSILIFYSLFYYFFLKSCRNNDRYEILPNHYNEKVIAFLSLIVTFFILWVYKDNLILLLFRESLENGMKVVNTNLTSTPLSLLFGLFIRPMPVLLWIIYKISCTRKTTIEILLIVFALISNFPLALPRFYVAALYLPLTILYLKNYLNKLNNLGYLILISVLIVFPFLNQGRLISDYSKLKIGLDFEMFNQGHFDSYINFVRVLDKEIITYGNQLIGVLLFFIPREFFQSKPIGSGGFLAKELNLDFDHISMNYFAEGYINFGYIGIFLFIIIIAYFNAKFDNLFLKIKDEKEFYLQKILFLIYLGLLFFNLRGDLISCFAYTIGMTVSLYCIYHLVQKFSRLKIKLF